MLYSVFMLALRSVQRNVLRSFLTILGIVIGVSAVITMVTLGNGATQAIKTQISSLGTNLLLVMPGQRGPGRCGAQALHRVALIGAGGAAGVGAVVHRRGAAVSRCSARPQHWFAIAPKRTPNTRSAAMHPQPTTTDAGAIDEHRRQHRMTGRTFSCRSILSLA